MKKEEVEAISIIKIPGSDKSIYPLIGPLVMNPVVLAFNGGYPFKNTEDHSWYVAVDNKSECVVGFLSILGSNICNDCTLNNQDILKTLIKEALVDIPSEKTVHFVANIEEVPLMEQLGFEVDKPGPKYVRMSRKV